VEGGEEGGGEGREGRRGSRRNRRGSRRSSRSWKPAAHCEKEEGRRRRRFQAQRRG
jgi:hypothetical protein